MRMRRLCLRLLVLVAPLALTACSLLNAPPTARFDVASAVLYASEPVRFDAAPTLAGSNLVDYQWDFGDGQTGSGREVTVAYASAGHYTVSLTVTDAEGRTDRTSREVTVYLRSGTRLFFEDFSDGPASLGRWPLDPNWASANDSRIEEITHGPGFTLLVDSGQDRWHRRYAAVELPPLRRGQHLVFTCQVMAIQTKRSHTFLIAPLRRDVTSPVGSLPYFEYSSDADGSYVREPTAFGTGVSRAVPFLPSVFRWHTYTFVYGESTYALSVDGVALYEGTLGVDFTEGGTWFILLGEESSTEACNAYFDEIEMMIEE